MSKLVVIIVLSVVVEQCFSQMPYRRIKRGKYYSNPPQRFYSRPPVSFPSRGIISYTPPPNFNDEEPSYPGSRPKVSKRPTNEGLGDDDINNLVKHLTKHDLDKIIEYAKGKERDYDYHPNEFKPNFDKYNEYRPSQNELRDQQNPYYKYNDNKLNHNDVDQYKPDSETPDSLFNKYTNEYEKILHQKGDKFKPSFQENQYDNKPDFNPNFVTEPTPMKYYQVTSPKYQEYSTTESINYKYSDRYPDKSLSYPAINNPTYSNPIETQGNMNQNPVYIDSNNDRSRYTQPLETQESMKANFYRNPYTDESSQQNIALEQFPPYSEDYNRQNDFGMREKEENLPKPKNLRDDTEYELSYTNKVPFIINAESSTYKVENFGDLPLMDYNSKLALSDSYNVPHYTVTSQSSFYEPPSSSLVSSSSSSYANSPPVEPAPPPSAAREQSDAHLKAIKIWSHKSRGTAYTLHDDGTLSLERPLKPKPSYGYGYS